jgi:hypothetical protein
VSQIANGILSVGNVPRLGGIYYFSASEPAMASIATAGI